MHSTAYSVNPQCHTQTHTDRKEGGEEIREIEDHRKLIQSIPNTTHTDRKKKKGGEEIRQ